MSKKSIIIAAKLIPVIAAVISYVLILGSFSAPLAGKVTGVTVLLAFLGFVFFFIGRKSTGESKAIKILGILDILSTISIIVLYALAIVSIGL